MNTNIAQEAANKLRELCRQENYAAFFKHLAQRDRNRASIRLNVVMREADVEVEEALEMAKELEDAGICEYKKGRPLTRSRLIWSYPVISIGKVALGEAGALDELDFSVFEEDDEEENIAEPDSESLTDMIAKVKRELANKARVSISQVEINIKF